MDQGSGPRDELYGWEWDFLGFDERGRLALISSAGYGPIPADVLARRTIVEEAVAQVQQLPEIGCAVGRSASTVRG